MVGKSHANYLISHVTRQGNDVLGNRETDYSSEKKLKGTVTYSDEMHMSRPMIKNIDITKNMVVKYL